MGPAGNRGALFRSTLMASERSKDTQAARPRKKAGGRNSDGGNAKEASDARAKTVRGIMKRNRDRGEE